MIRILLFMSILLAVSNTVPAEDTEERSPQEEIRSLIRKLGDDSFVVRQRAETQLLRIGIDAFSELRRALNDPDVEIVRRAEQILGQFELVYLGQEDESVRELVNLYTVEQNIAQKATYIWALANPMPYDGYPDGEGLRTLCRIARFDPERALRVEAVKCLIAMPPLAPSKQRKWYRSLARLFSDPGDDELFLLIRNFVRLRCEIDTAKDAAEKEALHQGEKGGNDPPGWLASEEVKRQASDFALQLDAFQKNPENNTIQRGNWIDMLLFYALIEIQNDVGLTEQRDRTLAAAQAIQTETIRSDNPLLPIDPLSGKSQVDHFFTGLILMERNRYRWSEQHFQRVFEEGEISLKVKSCSTISSIRQLLGNLPGAVEMIDKELEILSNEEYTSKYSDAEERKKEISARRLYYLAQMAADSEDWIKATELVEEVLKSDPYEIDTIILRHEIGRRRPELGQEYRDQLKALVEGAIVNVENQMRKGIRPQVVCNQVAWLLANTEGDYATAQALISVTMKLEPESSIYLDTQAHVFALGKEYDKAVEAQEKAVKFAPEAVVFRRALDKFRTLAREKR